VMAHCSESVEGTEVSGEVMTVDVLKMVLLLFPCCGDNRLVLVDELPSSKFLELFSIPESCVGKRLITLLVAPTSFLSGDHKVVVDSEGVERRCVSFGEIGKQFGVGVATALRFLGIQAYCVFWRFHGGEPCDQEKNGSCGCDGSEGRQELVSPLFSHEDLLSLFRVQRVLGSFDEESVLSRRCGCSEGRGGCDSFEGVFCGVEVIVVLSVGDGWLCCVSLLFLCLVSN